MTANANMQLTAVFGLVCLSVIIKNESLSTHFCEKRLWRAKEVFEEDGSTFLARFWPGQMDLFCIAWIYFILWGSKPLARGGSISEIISTRSVTSRTPDQFCPWKDGGESHHLATAAVAPRGCRSAGARARPLGWSGRRSIRLGSFQSEAPRGSGYAGEHKLMSGLLRQR